MYTAEDSDVCTVSLLNETAVSYEREKPNYMRGPNGKDDECNAEFSCSFGKIPEYRIQRYRTDWCGYDFLGLYNILSI